MKSLKVVSKDYSSLLSLADAKIWLNVIATDTEDDTLIQGLINGAAAYIENYISSSIGVNSYILTLDTFQEEVKLWLPPVSSVTLISYVDTGGAAANFDITKTVLNTDTGELTLKEGESWPGIAVQKNSIKISYLSPGMIGDNQGEDIITAMKMTVAERYDYRDNPNNRWKTAIDNILQPYRLRPFE